MDISELQDANKPLSKIDVIRRLLRSLEDTVLEVDGNHAQNAAQALVGDQGRLHERYISTVSNLGGKTMQRHEWSNALASVNRYAKDCAQVAGYRSEQSGGRWQVVSIYNAPIITEANLESMRRDFAALRIGHLVENDTWLVAAGIAVYFSRINVPIDSDPIQNLGPLRQPVRLALAMVQAVETFDQMEADNDSSVTTLGQRLEIQNRKVDTLLAQITESRQGTTSLMSEVQAGMEKQRKIGADLENFSAEQRKKIDEMSAASKSDFAALRETIGLTATNGLWKDRAYWAAVGFYSSGAILLLILAGFPILAIVFREDLAAFAIDLMTRFGTVSQARDGVAQAFSTLGQLLLISAPLGFLIWLVRLLVRYNMRSMLLMDDARQRLTMLDTYLFMIERDAATKQDRGAVLEALFRRPPGHGADTTEPPHFTDLLKYAQGSGAGKAG